MAATQGIRLFHQPGVTSRRHARAALVMRAERPATLTVLREARPVPREALVRPRRMPEQHTASQGIVRLVPRLAGNTHSDALAAQPPQPLSAAESAALRTKVVCTLALSFVLSNMDKTNFTVAIIPMAMSYGWTPTTAGLVQSAFFYGFLAMQIPGGMFANRLGGAFMLPRGVALWSAATTAVPLAAGNLPLLCLCRALTGAGEAVAPSSVIDVLTRIVPSNERASAVSFTFSGLHVGSMVGLLSSPLIIQAAGWPALFCTFGLAGGVWLLAARAVADEVARRDPSLAMALSPAGQAAGSNSSDVPPIPYRAFLRSRAVRVLMFTHFAHNWMHYTMLAWLPSYFVSTLSVDLMHAAQTALLPPMAGLVASTVAGRASDWLIASGVQLASVRKMAQSVAFLVPMACLAVAAHAPCGPDNSALAVGCITAALGLSSFSLAGLYCTHGDLSPKYASALLGLTNVAGSMPGILGVACVGALYDQTGDWGTALFLPTSLLLLAGAGAYVLLGSNDAIDFDAADNSELGIERALRRAWAAHPASSAAHRVTGVLRAATAQLGPHVMAAQQRVHEAAHGWQQRLTEVVAGIRSHR